MRKLNIFLQREMLFPAQSWEKSKGWKDVKIKKLQVTSERH